MRQADQPAERLVDGDDDAVLIREPHAVHGIFPDGAEQGFRTAQRHFRRAAFGDVADVKQQGRRAVKFHAHHADFHRHRAAVRAQAFAFNPGNLPGGQLLKFRAGRVAMRRRHQFLDRIFARSTARGSAVQRAGAAVDIQHVALQILDKNRVRRIFKQLAETGAGSGAVPPRPGRVPARRRTGRPASAACPRRVRYSCRPPALDEQHADDDFAPCGWARSWWCRPCRRFRAGGNQFRPARNDPPHQRVGRLGLRRGGNLHALALNRGDGQQRNDLVLPRAEYKSSAKSSQ